MDLHKRLAETGIGDFLTGFLIRCVETDYMDDDEAVRTAEQIVTDGPRFNDLLERGYDWLNEFKSFLEN